MHMWWIMNEQVKVHSHILLKQSDLKLEFGREITLGITIDVYRIYRGLWHTLKHTARKDLTIINQNYN